MTFLPIAAAVLLFIAPGYLLARACRATLQPLDAIPVGFGASFALLTLLNVPLFLLHLSVGALVVIWIALTAMFLPIAWRRSSPGARAWRPTRRSLILLTLTVVGLSVLALALSRAGAMIGGEEEIEIIIARKILESGGLEMTQVNYLKGLTPTYLLVPFYLFRAMLSYITRVDPVLLHYRLGFVGPVISLLAVAALVGELRRSQREAFAALALFSAGVALTPAGRSLPPFLFSVSDGSVLFFRGIFTVQALLPIWALCVFRAMRAREPFYVALAATLAPVILFVHGLDALYCLMMLGVIVVGECLFDRPLRLAWPRLGVVAVVLVTGIAAVAGWRAVYGHYQGSEELIDSVQRGLITKTLGTLQPVSLRLPDPAYAYVYFNERGTHFFHIDSLFMARFTPPMAIAAAVAPLLLLFATDAWAMWAAGSAIAAALVLRVPILLLGFLFVNISIFSNVYYFATVPLLISLWCVDASVMSMLASRAARPDVRRWAVPVLVALAIAGGWGLLAAGERLTLWARTSRDSALALLLIATVVALAVRLARRAAVSTPPSTRLSLSLAGVLLLPLLCAADAPAHARLIASLFTVNRISSPYEAAVERYAHVQDRQTVLSPGLYDALMHVRASVPPGRTFAADPAVIRAVPFVTNEYIVHSGVPFDFVEQYFAKYYRTAVSGAQHQVIPIDPLFRDDRSLEPDAIAQAAEFLRDFAVDYVVVTPAFHEYTAAVIERLAQRGDWSGARIYDAGGYAIYQVNRDPRALDHNGG